jgi:hypothetical protein
MTTTSETNNFKWMVWRGSGRRAVVRADGDNHHNHCQSPATTTAYHLQITTISHRQPTTITTSNQ